MASAESAPPGAAARPLLESPALLLWVLVLDLCALAALFLIARTTSGRLLAAHAGILSLATFLVFAVDKWRSARSGRRVSELNLLALCALGGALGGLAAMGLFRHKTQRALFTVLVPTLLFVHGVLAALVLLAT